MTLWLAIAFAELEPVEKSPSNNEGRNLTGEDHDLQDVAKDILADLSEEELATLLKTIRLTKMASANGDLHAKLMLADYYAHSQKNPEKALPYLHDAASLGDYQAIDQLDDLFQTGLVSEGWTLAWLESLKEKANITRDSELEYQIGRIYSEELAGAEYNAGVAAHWFELASDDDDHGKAAFAQSLLKGDGIRRDVARAQSLINDIQREGTRQWAEIEVGKIMRETTFPEKDRLLPETQDLLKRSFESLRKRRQCPLDMSWDECRVRRSS
ncbi:hypothetical protein [Shimia sp.]|uniref:hypothetical protein n=1 Tax=Shimia sp. TaxID=1954381 RepID=UPI0032999419